MECFRLSDKVMEQAICENLPAIKASAEKILKQHNLTLGSLSFRLKRTFLGDKLYVEFIALAEKEKEKNEQSEPRG